MTVYTVLVYTAQIFLPLFCKNLYAGNCITVMCTPRAMCMSCTACTSQMSQSKWLPHSARTWQSSFGPSPERPLHLSVLSIEYYICVVLFLILHYYIFLLSSEYYTSYRMHILLSVTQVLPSRGLHLVHFTVDTLCNIDSQQQPHSWYCCGKSTFQNDDSCLAVWIHHAVWTLIAPVCTYPACT